MKPLKPGRWWHEGITLVSGCTPCSPACQHDDGEISCWALRAEKRFPAISAGGEQYGEIRIHPERLDRIRNAKVGTVVSIWNDLWHPSVPRLFRQDAYNAMRHSDATFVILTKQPQNISLDQAGWFGYDDNNIFNGTSAWDQDSWNQNVSALRRNWPGKKIVSCGPLLGPITIDPCEREDDGTCPYPADPCDAEHECRHKLAGIIAEGETGPRARPSHVDWFRRIRDGCAQYGIPFYLKYLSKRVWMKYYEKDDDMRERYLDGLIELSNGWVIEMDGQPPSKTQALCRVPQGEGRILDGRTHDDLPWREI